MSFNIEKYRNLSLHLPIFLLLVLSISFNMEVQYVTASASSNAREAANTELVSSEARFFDCGVTPSNGTSSLLGLSPEESTQSSLTDRDLDTIVMGGAILNVSSAMNSSIVNIPGPELMVVEMAGAEPLNFSITVPETGEIKTLQLMPNETDDSTNNCDMAMNQVFVDLNDFEVPEGFNVTSVRIDNLGEPDTLIGSDIAEVFLLEPGTGDTEMNLETARPMNPLFPQ